MGLYMMSEKHLLTTQADWVEDESVEPFAQTKQQLRIILLRQVDRLWRRHGMQAVVAKP
jgi:hypothetical protein